VLFRSLFLDAPNIEDDAWEKGVARLPAAVGVLDDAITAFEDCHWDPAALHHVLEKVAEAHGLKLAKAQAPVRVAVTGRTVGPPLFESLNVLGRERTLERLRAARDRLAVEPSSQR
jgi:glutamyl-tRNA synthetase